MGMSGLNHNGVQYTLTTGEAIGDNLMVAINSSGLAVKAGVGGCPIGFTQQGYASGEVASIYSIGGAARIQAATTWSKGDFLKQAANGQLTPESPATTKTVDTIAVAEEAATAGDVAFGVIFI